MANPLVVGAAKLTMKFNGGSNGWSESHFYTGSPDITLAAAYNAAYSLCQYRVKALDGVNAKLFEAVLSRDDVNRDSRQIDISGIIANPTTGYSGVGGPDPSNTGAWAYQTVQMSWPVVLSTTNPTTQPIEYLAGMPASVSQFGPLPTDDTPPKVSSYLAAYLDKLVAGDWGANGRNWSTALYDIASIITAPAAGATPTQFQITFKAPFPAVTVFPVGTLCRLQNSMYTTPQKRLRLNGTYTVESYDSTAGLLKVNVPRVLVAPNFTAYGNLQGADGAVYRYTGYTLRPMTHRKRGRPFGAGRGRR